MRFIYNDEPPLRISARCEKHHVKWPYQQILEHRVVGQQQVGRIVTHLLATQDLVAEHRLTDIELGKRLPRSHRIGLGLAGVTTKCDRRISRKDLPEPLHLIIGQRVHWVQQQSAYPRSESPRLLFTNETIEDRYQEGFCFSRTGAGGHNEVTAARGLSDGLLLMDVQRTIQW